MSFHKSDSAGYAERHQALLAALPGAELPGQFAAGRKFKGVAADDMLDAVVAAWSAERVANGSAQVLPDVAETDLRGLRMEMVY
jgi:predicted RNase H-like nuclease